MNTGSITPVRTKSIVGEPEVVEDASTAETCAAWLDLKAAAIALAEFQMKDGSIPDAASHAQSRDLVARIRADILHLAPAFPHDAEYLAALDADFERWQADGFGVPDFLDSLQAFQPQQHRIDGLQHLVVFPMYTQNGTPDRHVEALIAEVIWPEFIADVGGRRLREQALRLASAPGLHARLRHELGGAVPRDGRHAHHPGLHLGRALRRPRGRPLPPRRQGGRRDHQARPHADRRTLLAAGEEDQQLREETFVMWDLIHDRSHMRGDLPFDPFMIKQRMPYFLYSLEELRCDLTAFRESRQARRRQDADPETRARAEQVQHAIVFDRIFRFPLTGNRVRNYDGARRAAALRLVAPARSAALDRHPAHHRLGELPAVVVALSRPDQRAVLEVHRPAQDCALARGLRVGTGDVDPESGVGWARGLPDEILAGPPKGYTDAVLADEFPLSMFYEALGKRWPTCRVARTDHGITWLSRRRSPAGGRDRRIVRRLRCSAVAAYASARLARPSSPSAPMPGDSARRAVRRRVVDLRDPRLPTARRWPAAIPSAGPRPYRRPGAPGRRMERAPHHAERMENWIPATT